jgi:hypothetical protein
VGINWWENDPWLNADAGRRAVEPGSKDRRRPPDQGGGLREENRQLRRRIRELESGARDD